LLPIIIVLKSIFFLVSKLTEAFKEVKYLKQFVKDLNVPPEAEALYNKYEILKNYSLNAENICRSYNKIILKTRQEEKKLIEKKIIEIDEILNKGEHEITWDTIDLSEYLLMIKAKVKDLELRVRKSKVNIKRIKDLTNVWRSDPLFKRSSYKSALQINNKKSQLNERYASFKEANNKITVLISENKEYLLGKNTELKLNEFDMWKKYVLFVDEIVESFLHETIDCSLRYVHFNLNSNRKSLRPFIEAQLVLESSNLSFACNVDNNSIDIKQFFIELLSDIINQADCFELLSCIDRKETFKV
jgi:dynein heavy chain, axonemal